MKWPWKKQPLIKPTRGRPTRLHEVGGGLLLNHILYMASDPFKRSSGRGARKGTASQHAKKTLTYCQVCNTIMPGYYAHEPNPGH